MCTCYHNFSPLWKLLISITDPCMLFCSKVVKKADVDDDDEIIQWSDDSSFVSTPPSRLPGLHIKITHVCWSCKTLTWVYSTTVDDHINRGQVHPSWGLATKGVMNKQISYIALIDMHLTMHASRASQLISCSYYWYSSCLATKVFIGNLLAMGRRWVIIK